MKRSQRFSDKQSPEEGAFRGKPTYSWPASAPIILLMVCGKPAS
jgi:hypothetical protein